MAEQDFSINRPDKLNKADKFNAQTCKSVVHMFAWLSLQKDLFKLDKKKLIFVQKMARVT